MNRTGKIIQCKDNVCEIEFVRLTACKDCGQCNLGDKVSRISLEGNYTEGDYVEVCLPDNQFLKATAIAYVLPLLGLGFGMALGHYYFPTGNDMSTLIGGVLGLGISLLGIDIAEKLRKKTASWEPYIISKVDNPGCSVTPSYITNTNNIDKEEN